MVTDYNTEAIQQMAGIFSKALSQSITGLLLENCTWSKKQAADIDELCRIFGIGKSRMLEICRKKDSPAWKSGGITSPWLCFPDQMYKYLLKTAEPFKS